MQIQTQNLTLVGFDRIQEVLMRLGLANIKLPDTPAIIELHQEIEYGKCSSIWYGGILASITSGENEFSLYANGDVRAYLIDKRNDETIAYVKDKSNAGCFGDEMSQYIKNDAHLMEIIREEDPIYSLEIDDNNWFEVFFDKLNGVETVVALSVNVIMCLRQLLKLLKISKNGQTNINNRKGVKNNE